MKNVSSIVLLASTICLAENIGVLANKGCCSDAYYATIDLDVEDHKNATGIKNKTDPNPIGISLGGHAVFSYCTFEYQKMVRVPYDYIVLRMDKKCPKGTYAFARRHDTQDGDNGNDYSGDIWPNGVWSNARLEYCFVPADSKSNNKYPFKKKYGIFANPKNVSSSISSNIAHSEIYIDDEDDSNNNSWSWGEWLKSEPGIRDRILKIVNGDHNTTYHTIRWKGSDSDLPAMSTTSWTTIGLLKDKGSCKRPLKIDLDVEDDNNRTGVQNKTNPNPPGIELGGHAVFNYCAVDVDEIPRVPYDYMVLKLGKFCPKGTLHVTRRHDTEDSNNANDYSGDIWPSEVWSNARLEYCFVPADGGSKTRYPYEGYGIFANPKNVSSKILSNIAHSEIFIDDEDDRSYKSTGDVECEMRPDITVNDKGEWVDNGQKEVCEEVYAAASDNYWSYHGMSSSNKSKVEKIMFGEDNTTYHVIRWTGSSSAIMAKSAETDVIDAPMVAAAPLAPAIKGLDRNVVAVELKSAGDAKISVVNVKGAVVANIAEKNLQPGVHQVKWNSGMVPGGRYVVKIEQNGMVDAKNVILK